jgi:hypothetical protein
MRRLITLAALAVALAGCATGLPGSPQRAYYDLCMQERQDAAYCEPWAAIQAHQNAPKPGLVLIQPMLGAAR